MNDTEIKRDNSIDLFNALVNEAREAGALHELDRITDYCSASDFDADNKLPLTNFEFNFEFIADWGGSEGIYIDVFIRGRLDESDKNQRRHIGTIKTLESDFDGMKKMGEACGILHYYASRYVNRNLDRYEPDKSKIGQFNSKDIPFRCRSCHNFSSVKLITQPNLHPVGMLQKLFSFRCEICGCETQAHRTPTELLSAWESGQYWCGPNDVILVSQAALQEVCKKRQLVRCNQQCGTCPLTSIKELRWITQKQ